MSATERPGEAQRLVVCITGASGSIYARRLLQLLAAARAGTGPGAPARPGLRVDVVASHNAPQVWAQELGEPMPADFGGPSPDLGVRRWDRMDFRAPFASGSNAPDAVIAMPCSMSTLARVANGGGTDLIARACEVALKERRPLILVVRETPLSLVHLRNMVAATEAGAIVLPAVPSFYGHVTTLEQAVDTVVVRALDRAGLRLPLIERWGDDP
ncbi:UbiX family flavin prenyltransferase [Paraliomyxa miuraensis]|uniref:UbiX family flavin prenyltransferase n=1 Tax=Paraliomyxa miuraensis TaxID=376150 RepID=UPI00225879C7|nr:UbiX family flavin prenyltransferase [Paraliomyxa miuraensis]MCX4244730.1 UbiX family flavin prenyltransferase [Paraliomyxa miuraensis]